MFVDLTKDQFGMRIFCNRFFPHKFDAVGMIFFADMVPICEENEHKEVMNGRHSYRNFLYLYSRHGCSMNIQLNEPKIKRIVLDINRFVTRGHIIKQEISAKVA